ncbi:PQQ-dependent sugar dehydrogenase [Vallicoccus soli]|uniref:PKD domain-containing protein n=1 Tax=Vallicoccus soli TaxID=2339232 RepID=A0A3A3Z5M1_9ACTN|nr:PQQ-dependent sugar dehydrogenase [Vallicoccus soli]RJK97008.1 PKD domain-containing protein [Vallicoccus soli]
MRRALPLAVLATALGGLTATVPLTTATAAPSKAPAAAQAPDQSAFQKVTLNDRPGEPISLAVTPDGRVLHTARDGRVFIHDPKTGLNPLAAKVPVYLHDEEGLQGVAVDPNFAKNKWVYLYYSPLEGDTPEDDPLTPDVNEGDAPFEITDEQYESFKGALRLSRFKLIGNELKLDTEQEILEVPVDRGICCHVGGQIDFDSKGNLYLSTGDDSNPFESDGYVPVDDREGRHPAFDARRTSGNTNDLRGKLLRIKPKAGGGYTIPKGNLFAPGTEKTRPEIYAMGLRNPFRFDVDPQTDTVYMADYSPDANQPSDDRGPAGHGRWMVIDEPANYGWPFCVQPDIPYRDYDFATETPGDYFNCKAVVNDSPYNTGLEVLPPVAHSEIIYSYGASRQFPELGTGGIGPMAGPAYDFKHASKSAIKWPAYYDGKPLFYEWTRDFVQAVTTGPGGEVASLERVAPDVVVDGPMDMEFGPDGALYVLEYGTGYFAELPEAQLARIDYTRGNRTPEPKVAADVVEGQTPLTVTFSSEGTTDADGDSLRYRWDFDADGKVDSYRQNPTFTYEENGAYDATLTVIDETGRRASASVRVIVGNEAPVVTFVTPQTGDTFAFGDAVRFEVQVTDDQPVDCNNVIVSYVLGHDDHGHPLTAARGCSGTIQTPLETGHAGASNLRGVFQATYTDTPEDGLPARSGTAEVVLEPSNG